MLRKLFHAAVCLLAVVAVLGAQPAEAAKKRKSARAAIQMVALPKPVRPQLVVNVSSGAVMHAQEARALWHPASLTKLMTAYVVFQALKGNRVRFDTPLTVSVFANQQKPSKMGFRPGSIVTVEAALYMIMVKSANDMSVTLAEGISGSVPAFAAEMNAWSQKLGMTDSYWRNPNGLPDDAQVTSARDLAILARALINDFPGLQPFLNVQAIQIGDAVISNHNPLLGRLDGADGLKTGYICASGFNMVGTATRGGVRHIAVVLGADLARARTQWAALLLEKSFARNAPTQNATLQGLPRAGAAIPTSMKPYVCSRGVKKDDMERVNAEILAFAPTSVGGFGAPPQGDGEDGIRQRTVSKKYASLLAARPSAVQAVVMNLDKGDPKLQIPLRVALLGRPLPPLPAGAGTPSAAPLPLAPPFAPMSAPSATVKKNS